MMTTDVVKVVGQCRILLSPDTLVGNDDDPCNDDDDDDSSDSCYGNHDQQLLYTDTRHATSVRCTLGRIYAHRACDAA